MEISVRAGNPGTSRKLWIFLVSWLIINLIQAAFTGLFHDEAYYFFYSRDLAWGYYDHPPLTAVFIRLGSLLFPDEFGIRFFFVLLSLGTFFILFKLSEVKNGLLFGVMLLSFLIFQVTGFLALPDSVLLFFTALFFVVYRKFSRDFKLIDGLLLGLVMAGMFYSKYLGILIVFFTVISNLRLLLRPAFWLAVLVTTVLFVPHLVWQWNHDFPSFYYHLLERSHDEVFRWTNFGDYIGGQAGQVNPLLFIPVIWFLIAFKPSDLYERALKFTSAGIFLFPFLMMIKGRVEANWTIAGIIPLFLIAYRMAEIRPRWNRFILFSGVFSLIMVILIRFFLITDILPQEYTRKLKLQTSGWEDFTEKISEIAGHRPVVFIGSYQFPSKYIFYTGKLAHSFNEVRYRGNQFDLEGIEESLQGKEVLMVFPGVTVMPAELEDYSILLNDSISDPNGDYKYYYTVKNYHTYNFIKARVEINFDGVKAGSETEIPVTLINQEELPVDFSEAFPGKVYLTYHLLQYGKPVIYEKAEDISLQVLDREYKTSFRMKAPEKAGIYYLRVSIKNGWLPPGINSRLVKINVE